MAFGVFHLQPSSQAEQSSPPPAQPIYLLSKVTHQGLLKKIHFSLKPREPVRSLSLADELREELKHSIKLSAETKSCSAFLFLFFFFPSLLKKCLIFTSVKLERQEIIQRLFTKPGFFLLWHLC